MRTNYSFRSVEDLLQALNAGYQAHYLCFWGHQPEADGSVGKGCLSQWFPAEFSVDGDRYATAEHYMMAEKARLFADEPARQQILASATPAEAKALGRGVRGFDAERWQAACLDIVVQGNVAKFGQNEAMRAFLLGTGSKVLVEASPRDRIWGIGMGAANPAATQPAQWRGRNLLGFALMAAREQLLAGGLA